jgi:hypothetical protein
MFNVKGFRTCTFQGLGTKKQEYLNMLAEVMKKKNLQKVEEPSGVIALVLEGRGLIFESPSRVEVGIRAVSIKENLRVGFAVQPNVTRKKAVLWLIVSILVASFFVFLSAYIIGHGMLPLTEAHGWAILIPFLTFFAAFSCMFLPYVLKTEITWPPKIRKLLVETAESIGGKQITPFRKTTVELEY